MESNDSDNWFLFDEDGESPDEQERISTLLGEYEEAKVEEEEAASRAAGFAAELEELGVAPPT